MAGQSALQCLLSPQRVQFAAQSARYVKFEADAVAGGGTQAIVGEVAVGSSEAAEGDGGETRAGKWQRGRGSRHGARGEQRCQADGRIDDASVGARDATADASGGQPVLRIRRRRERCVRRWIPGGKDATIVDTGFADVYLSGDAARTEDETGTGDLASSDGEASDASSPVGTPDDASGDDSSVWAATRARGLFSCDDAGPSEPSRRPGRWAPLGGAKARAMDVLRRRRLFDRFSRGTA